MPYRCSLPKDYHMPNPFAPAPANSTVLHDMTQARRRIDPHWEVPACAERTQTSNGDWLEARCSPRQAKQAFGAIKTGVGEKRSWKALLLSRQSQQLRNGTGCSYRYFKWGDSRCPQQYYESHPDLTIDVRN